MRSRQQKTGDAENARRETTGNETTAPKCRGGNSKKGISGTKMQGWKLRETETTAKCCRAGKCET